MFYPEVAEPNNSRGMVDTWLGYNHNYRIGAGEFYDMENLCTDNYPLFSPRKTRPLLIRGENIRGMLLTDNTLAYIDGSVFHYGGRKLDLTDLFASDPTGRQQLIRYGAYVLIFPAGIYVSLTDYTDYGSMASGVTAPEGTVVTYSICNHDGTAYDATVSATAPEDPSNGDYWLDTKPGEEGLYVYYDVEHGWQPVATTYLKVRVNDVRLDESFAVGDTVTMNSSLPDINSGSRIEAIGEDYIVVTGIMTGRLEYSETTSDVWEFSIQRKVPELDFTCVSNNRIWGCHYGLTPEGQVTNEIYASKLGDFKNWYSYEGLSTDSYALSVGEPGEWTGAIAYNGYPVFFKENAILRIYGNMPAEYQLLTTTCRGVQRGSDRSLVRMNEYLIYKSATDIVVYDGSSPTSISAALGRGMYYDAVGGGCLGKYYICMEDELGRPFTFVYDMKTGLWAKESALEAKLFTASENGQIYASTDKEIYGLGASSNALFLERLPGEPYVSWWGETGDIGFEYPDFKYVKRLTVRAWIGTGARLQVDISHDDRAYENVCVLRGNNSLGTRTATIVPRRCDHYRLRFSGEGDVMIYTMTTTLEAESEEDYGSI